MYSIVSNLGTAFSIEIFYHNGFCWYTNGKRQASLMSLVHCVYTVDAGIKARGGESTGALGASAPPPSFMPIVSAPFLVLC